MVPRRAKIAQEWLSSPDGTGPYREREPWSSHFIIWPPKRNPVRTQAGFSMPVVAKRPSAIVRAIVETSQVPPAVQSFEH